MPLLAGKCRNNSIVASNAPAEPPTPTIGQAKGCVFERAVRRSDFAPVLSFAFVCDAFFCAVRLGAMAAFFMLICGADHTSIEWQRQRDRGLGLPLARANPRSEKSTHFGRVAIHIGTAH